MLRVLVYRFSLKKGKIWIRYNYFGPGSDLATPFRIRPAPDPQHYGSPFKDEQKWRKKMCRKFSLERRRLLETSLEKLKYLYFFHCNIFKFCSYGSGVDHPRDPNLDPERKP